MNLFKKRIEGMDVDRRVRECVRERERVLLSAQVGMSGV
jgi:hypothetical protein